MAWPYLLLFMTRMANTGFHLTAGLRFLGSSYVLFRSSFRLRGLDVLKPAAGETAG